MALGPTLPTDHAERAAHVPYLRNVPDTFRGPVGTRAPVTAGLFPPLPPGLLVDSSFG